MTDPIRAAQSLGFTGADVDLLRTTADREDEAVSYMGSSYRSPLHDLADRLEALLPPEGA